MKRKIRALKRRIRRWLDCRLHRCDYYSHYLVYGPAEMPHASYHLESERAERHFDQCRYNDRPRYRDGFTPAGKLDICPVCLGFEKRLRA